MSAGESGRDPRSRPPHIARNALRRRLPQHARSVATGASWLVFGDWLRDARLGARKMLRRPAVSAALVLTLALGIGANAAIFSVVNQVLLQPLPYPEPERLRILHTDLPLQGSSLLKTSGPELLDLADAGSFASYGGIWFRPGALTDEASEPEDIGMAFVSAGFLPTLGVSPAIGRWPTADEDVAGAEQVIVLADHLWQRRYGADPEIVGRRIEFDGVPHTVVGVMPPDFRVMLPPDAGVPTSLDAWVPFGGAYEQYPRGWRVLTVVARLAPETLAATASTELGDIAARLRSEHDEYAGSGLVLRLESLGDDIVGHVRPLLLLLLGAVWLMLLIVCANCVNLVLAGMTEGQHELAVRAALGASRGRLVRQFTAENALIVAAGAAAGVALARWAIEVLPLLAPQGLLRQQEVSLDWPVLAFVGLLATATVLVFSLASALQVRQGQRNLALRSGGRVEGDASHQLLRNSLVVFEVAVCLMLLIGVGLMVQSFAHLTRQDSGFEPAGLMTVKLSLIGGYRLGKSFRRLPHRHPRISQGPGRPTPRRPPPALGRRSRQPQRGRHR